MQEKFTDSGIILLDKPKGISSAKAVAILKHKLNCKKIGHAGTLDPMATGLLVCLINGATRVADLAQAGDKIYSGEILLGRTTTTDDVEGDVLTESNDIPDFATIEAAAKEFIGEQLQVPPQISAIKIDGKRSYALARSGEQVEITPRKINIFSFEIAKGAEKTTLNFKIHCSKGTYIRSIARDLGAELGCGGCLAALRREYSYPFSINLAKEIENIDRNDIVSWCAVLPDTPKVAFETEVAQRIRSGDTILLPELLKGYENCSQLIYGDKSTGVWLGVLKRVSDVWKIACNLV